MATIVLIHGLWLNPVSWEGWKQHFEQKGHQVIAPAWPGMEGSVEEVRQHTERYAGIGLKEITDHYDAIIRGLDSPPVIMGHSFGGLITQLLLDRGLGAAGVAIDPAPVKGILKLPLSTLRVSFPVLRNPANVRRSTALTPEQFHYAFTNTLSDEEAAAVYERYEVPGPDRVLFQAGLANFNPSAPTRVNFHNDARAPLLLIAGGKDHISPASLTKANFDLFKHSKAITEYKEFPERSHFTIGERGWEAVADYAIDWAAKNAAEFTRKYPSLRTTETMRSFDAPARPDASEHA